jgi:hypothetical protein
MPGILTSPDPAAERFHHEMWGQNQIQFSLRAADTAFAERPKIWTIRKPGGGWTN